MSPITHFLAGWVLAEGWSGSRLGPLRRREKAMIVAAGVAPDIDGLGIIPELLTRHTSHPLLWFSEYHHLLHTLAFAIVVTVAACLVSVSKFVFGPSIRGQAVPSHPVATAMLAFLSFHLHLFCDLIGARGPEGYPWPIPYLKPFSNSLPLTWRGQWPLNGWENFVFTGALLLATFWLTWRNGSSPLELLSEKWNTALVEALRNRFPARAGKAA